jgi:hypothetical protein
MVTEASADLMIENRVVVDDETITLDVSSPRARHGRGPPAELRPRRHGAGGLPRDPDRRAVLHRSAAAREPGATVLVRVDGVNLPASSR